MRPMLFVPILLLAACASHPVDNVSVPAPQSAPASRPQVNETNEGATQRFLQNEAQRKEEQARIEDRRPVAPVARNQPYRDETNDAASERFLYQEMFRQQEQARWEERQRAEAAERAQPRVVERVYVDRYYPYHDYPYHDRYRYRSSTTFPAATILGGTVGGIIGHQSHRTGRGIAIGSGVGLLLDVFGSRW